MVFDEKNHKVPEGYLVSTQAVREYLALVWEQYKCANRKLKTKILDELSRNLGIHRKSAVRLMKSELAPRSLQGKAAKKNFRYSEESKKELVRVWKKMGYMGSLRMKAAFIDWLPFYDECSIKIKDELLRMSPKTMDRYLADARAELNRRINTGTQRGGLRKFVTEIPIRNLGERPVELGHCELDTVAHCGGSLSGEFAWTLTVTDIVSGTTECEAIWCKTGVSVRNALKNIESRLPFDIRAIYVDNGSEFLNDDVINGFVKDPKRKTPIKVFRSRPYKKNDQAYVEQKNYTHVRKLFGYGRIDWENAVSMMNHVYRNEWSLIQNIFSPQQQLIQKRREGAKQKRTMSVAITPYQRLMNILPEAEGQILKNKKDSVDPFETMQKLKAKVRNIFGYFKNSIPISERGKVVV